jgi:hypothetical protein
MEPHREMSLLLDKWIVIRSKHRYQSDMMTRDIPPAISGDFKGIFHANHADPTYPFLAFDGNDHAFFERVIKSPGDDRILWDLKADLVT